MKAKHARLSVFFIFCILNLLGCEDDIVPEENLNYQTIVDLELPFNGSWFVVWGGRTVEQNYHASLTDQRFAIDVVQIENGSTFTANGLRNEDYYCFGDTLFAPGEGHIVEMENLVPENTPRQVNKNQLFGNYVIIDHGNDEYSVLAHFMKNSIKVKVGNLVARGQALGLVGNSGNSTEPHLHYHLQNKPSISQGEGLPAKFLNYYANDVFVSVGEPLKNQQIRKD